MSEKKKCNPLINLTVNECSRNKVKDNGQGCLLKEMVENYKCITEIMCFSLEEQILANPIGHYDGGTPAAVVL